MTKYPRLTLTEIKRRRARNKQDKSLHELIDKGGRKDSEEDFNKLLKKASETSKA